MEKSAGRLAKQDVLVRVSDDSSPLHIEIKSSVSGLYGRALQVASEGELKRLKVSNGAVCIDDNQALDFVIRARIRAAVYELRDSGADI